MFNKIFNNNKGQEINEEEYIPEHVDDEDVVMEEVVDDVMEEVVDDVDWFEKSGEDLVRRGVGIKSFIIRCAAENGVDGTYPELVDKIGTSLIASKNYKKIAEEIIK